MMKIIKNEAGQATQQYSTIIWKCWHIRTLLARKDSKIDGQTDRHAHFFTPISHKNRKKTDSSCNVTVILGNLRIKADVAIVQLADYFMLWPVAFITMKHAILITSSLQTKENACCLKSSYLTATYTFTISEWMISNIFRQIISQLQIQR